MKYCAKCGNANTDEAVFCSSCGSPLEKAPVAPPPPAPEPVTYTAPQTPAYTALSYDTTYSAPAAAVTETKNTATLWLILNIVLTVLCCPFSFVFSVIGIITAAIGMGNFNKGDYEDMKKKTKISMIMFIIGAVLGLVIEIITIVILLSTGALASWFSSSGY